MLRYCSILLFALAAVFAPQGRAGLEVTNTTFGWDPVTQTPNAGGTSALSKFPAMAVNQELQIIFNGTLNASSFNNKNVVVETVPSSILQPLGLVSSLPGGLIAPVTLKVKKNKLSILPAVLITGGQISFGFAPGAFYRLKLKGGKNGIEGSGGNLSKTLFIQFRTTDQVIDSSPGAPLGDVTVIDSDKGALALKSVDPLTLNPSQINVTTSPAPSFRIKFNELIQPGTIVDAATNGSPSVRIEVDADGSGTTLGDRSNVPGTFALESSQSLSTLVWKSKLAAFPKDSVVVITVLPFIEDLVGNSIFNLTGDVGAIRTYVFRTGENGVTILPPIVEAFENQNKLDLNSSSADWGLASPGFLINGPGGGTGEDGPFSPTDALVILPTYDIDLGPTVPRVYNFSSFNIPSGTTVRGDGIFPLVIRCTGPVTISGTLDVSGDTPDLISPQQILPGAGGSKSLGGAAGGEGGSVTFGAPDYVKTVSNLGAGDGLTGYAAAAAIPTRGLSGRVTSVSDYAASVTLATSLLPSFASSDNTAKLIDGWAQPNTGTGADTSFTSATPGGAILHNHPTFRIVSYTHGTPASLTVVSNINSDDYFGPLTQPGLDFYEFPPPALVRVGDPVVVGDLGGHTGDTPKLPGMGGSGSDPLTVAQDFITQVRSGGGGGGGSRTPGEDGETSPNFGSSEGSNPGSAGSGSISATLASFTATTLTATGTPFAGLSLGAGSDPVQDPPAIVFPSITLPYVFEIESNTANTLTVKVIHLAQTTVVDTNLDTFLNLSDVAGLVAGATMRIEPGFTVGGGGGGGSGVHLGGTAKSTAAPNLNLPNWTPGVGGGGGGGVLVVESADRIGVSVTGQILARGGSGGRTTGSLAQSASGGGGGGGGTVVLRSTDTSTFAVNVVGLVDATGGVGGFGYVEGGSGGDGRVRFENRIGNLIPTTYQNSVDPAPQAADLGTLIPGLSATVGLSEFFFSGLLEGNYTDFKITYEADINGIHTTGLQYTRADMLANVQVPFTLGFNDAELSSTGGVDSNSIDLDFVTDPSTLTGAWIRFRLFLQGSTTIGPNTYENVKIDTVEVDVTST